MRAVDFKFVPHEQSGSWLHSALRAEEQAVRASVTHLVATGQERGDFVCLVGDCGNSPSAREMKSEEGTVRSRRFLPVDRVYYWPVIESRWSAGYEN